VEARERIDKEGGRRGVMKGWGKHPRHILDFSYAVSEVVYRSRQYVAGNTTGVKYK